MSLSFVNATFVCCAFISFPIHLCIPTHLLSLLTSYFLSISTPRSLPLIVSPHLLFPQYIYPTLSHFRRMMYMTTLMLFNAGAKLWIAG